MVEKTRSGSHYFRPIALVVTLDVKNAFNSASWKDMLYALEVKFRIPKYLMRMIKNYLKYRELVYDTPDGPRRKTVSSGAAQVSIFGPELWSASYDGILRLDSPKSASIVGYADDIVAIILAKDVGVAQNILNVVMRRINIWMENHSLSLALQKSETIILTTRKIETLLPIQMRNVTINSQNSIRYLGVFE